MLQWEVFAVLLGPKVFAAMLVDVRKVNERRNQKWDPAQQVPHNVKGTQIVIRSLVNDLVNEHRCPIKQQTRNHKINCL